MRVVIGLLNVLMTVVFLGSVLVQYNDADALVWIAIYGAAAAVCMAYAMGRMKPWHAYAVAVVTVIWAAAIAPGFWGAVSFPDLFAEWEMKSEPVERAREFGGLLIVATWMTTLAVSHRMLGRRRSNGNPDRK